jgi:peptidoglycan/xylan/chitin deacetylase (PgdA/CDA1 family)
MTEHARTASEAGAPARTSRYRHIDGWAYPDGVRLAVNFTIDFDAMLNRRALGEPPMELTQGEFGGRTGIWRLMDLFERQQVGLTIFVPGRICELYPASVRDAARRGFEVANHMWEHRIPGPDLDWDHVSRTTKALADLTGRRPVGTRSRHRLVNLARDGYLYTSNGAADEIPYYVSDGDTTLLNLPFHYALDDAMYFHFGWFHCDNAGNRLADCDDVYDIWLAAFDRLYEAGTYANICTHDFVSGRGLRIAMLERLITEMKRRPGVWFPTCEELARYCYEKFPPSAAKGI